MKITMHDVLGLAYFFASVDEPYLLNLFIIAADVLRQRIGHDRYAALLRKLLENNAAFNAMEEACDGPK